MVAAVWLKPPARPRDHQNTRGKKKHTKTHIQNFSGSWFIQSSKPSNSHENGYGSIPINTIFNGMNIHLPAILGFTRYQGFDPSPNHSKSSKSTRFQASCNVLDTDGKTPLRLAAGVARPSGAATLFRGPKNKNDILLGCHR